MGQLIAYIGTYGAAPEAKGGGIFGLTVSQDGRSLQPLNYATEPKDAGYLVFAPETSTLYVVDERKTDGRGPVDPPATVQAFDVDMRTGSLNWKNSQLSPGPRPTFLDYSAKKRLLISANHGDFQHVEKVVRLSGGEWSTQYVYDDSTVVVFPLEADGSIARASDVHVFDGHGLDPNTSPQNGGHAQASPHAHCAAIDPSGGFLLVCDKGTDRIEIFKLGDQLEKVFQLQFETQTGPRHLAFDPVSGLAFATLEFSSELASFRFDPATATLTRLDTVSTLGGPCDRCNEPAEVRVHPGGGFVYVNNRGEDSLAWFSIDGQGILTRCGAVALAPSIHPGLAARSFAFAPAGNFLLVADRPADLVRSYEVCPQTGALSAIAQVNVPDPAFVVFVELN